MGRAPVAIIGVGNFLMGDEGVGIHAVHLLTEGVKSGHWTRPRPCPMSRLDPILGDDVEIIDGGTPGFSLLYMIEGRRLAIIIDCADFGGRPGEVAVFDPDELSHDARPEISLHSIDLLSVLDLARRTGCHPEKVRIIGIQPGKIEMGTELSNEAERSLNKIFETIAGVIEPREHFTEKTGIL